MNYLEKLHLEVINNNICSESNYSRILGKNDAASKSAKTTQQVAIEFGNFLFSKGIEYYDDLVNGVNYTVENKEGTFTMKGLFQEFLKTKQ